MMAKITTIVTPVIFGTEIKSLTILESLRTDKIVFSWHLHRLTHYTVR